MSSAEPFMPAHEPPPPKPYTDVDIDHDEDVIFDEEDGSAGGPSFDETAPPPPFRRPVPGAHMNHDELEEDFPAGVDDAPER
ncbi:hypothetical protein P0L94_17005 [Microbacter sp. GSS18]|nr:hypothetical protein P0L94_17005 [Microbacter sp. GSS18]